MENLKLIVFDNIKDLGDKVNFHLKGLNGTDEDYIIPVRNDRFSNGEGKVVLGDSVRGKDIYVLSDVGNYGVTYKMRNMEVPMSPDEHFQDIKRVISATGGHASSINVVTPLLYQSRQHRRKEMESLDCALALQELENLNVSGVTTFDAHDPNVANSIFNMSFENFYPVSAVLSSLVRNEGDNLNDLYVVAPDMGARERAKCYADMLGTTVGVFYKKRDTSKIVDGKNPIASHIYLGDDVSGKDVIVVDDMIASGQSMIDVAKELKERGAKRVFLVATFALMTSGKEVFDEAYNMGYFDRLYSTNLSYVPSDITSCKWYEEVDCSYFLAKIIKALSERESLELCSSESEENLSKVRKMSR